MEDEVKVKEQLIEEAKKLSEEEGTDKLSALANLKKKWKRTLSEEESLFDAELQEKFNSYIDKAAEKFNELKQSSEEKKNEIIEEAKKLLESENFKAATAKMNELFENFKHSGNSNKEKDDELWEKFREVKNEFYAKKDEYYSALKGKFEESKKLKEELIEKAKETLTVENFKEATKKMDELMEQWKKAGNSGKQDNDSLWYTFNTLRQEFYEKRSAYYTELKNSFKDKAEAKKEIIAQAKKCVANGTYTEEEEATVKSLRTKWKEVGFSGKENEDALWNEFNEIMNNYFENRKYYKN